MGKTKMNIVSAEAGTKKKSYEEKRAAKAAKETQTVEPVEAPIEETAPVVEVEAKSTPKVAVSESRGKKYKAVREKVEYKAYKLAEAVKLVRETSYSSFPGSVELHLVLNEGTVNTRVELPHSTGITRKIEVASDETVEKLKSGKIDFDVLITTPEFMSKLVPFARLLGPRGMMPNPKNGTVVDDPKRAIAAFSGNAINVKTEKSAPLVHLVIAKTNQEEKEIADNIKAVFENIGAKRIKKAVISPSMGPGIQVQVA
jgi:large subunit ribosomal protein L1